MCHAVKESGVIALIGHRCVMRPPAIPAASVPATPMLGATSGTQSGAAHESMMRALPPPIQWSWGTLGAHQRENRPEALRTAKISSAGQAACRVHPPRSETSSHKTRPTGRLLADRRQEPGRHREFRERWGNISLGNWPVILQRPRQSRSIRKNQVPAQSPDHCLCVARCTP